MGTRGLMGFVVDGRELLTYNHYDSYPDGLGVDVLNWLKSLDANGLQAAKEQARALELVAEDDKPTEEQIQRLRHFADTSVGSQGISNTEVHDWYQLLRQTQGVPRAALEAGFMIESNEFAYDSLFCEYAYVVDFDQNLLEAYKGFQREYPTAGRWSTDEARDRYNKLSETNESATSRSYTPIQLIASWPLDALPTDRELIKAYGEEDE